MSLLLVAATASLGGCGASLSADTQSGLTSTERLNARPAAFTEANADVRSSSKTVTTSALPNAPKASPSAEKSAAVQNASTKTSASAESAAAEITAVATPGTSAYKIGPQDVIEISVFKAPELSKSVQVADNGLVNLPLLGEVQAASKTAQEVERELAAKLGSKYLQKPQVTVFVKEYNSQRVTLEGAVKKPGVYPVRGRVTLLQYVALAEGMTENSDNTLVIFRTTNGKRAAAKFEIGEIRSGAAPDPLVQSGDVIIAPTSAMKEAFNTLLKALPLAAISATLL